MVDVSVLIVTWNSAGEIKECIESVIRNSKHLSLEFIVIDNNSSDGSFDIAAKSGYENLHTYRNNENLRYTKAVNQAVNYSTGRKLFLLNPDTIFKEGTIDALSSFIDSNPEYGASAPLLLNEDGSAQHSVRSFPDYWKMFCEFSLLAYIFPKSKMFGSWKMKYLNYNEDADVMQPMAAALMIRKEVIDSVGLMDERYEMFFNDVDLCKRIIDSGQKIRLFTAAKITHMHGASVKKDRVRMIKMWNKDCIEYFRKFHNNPVLLLWLKINLKFSEIIRTIYYKIK